MRTEDEIRNRLEQLQRHAYEHAAGCGEAPREATAEISTLRWVLGEE